MNLTGSRIRLRAVEPQDVETMYAWENDPRIWRVSGTLTPFSRHMLQRFVEEQRFDIYQTRQLRLMIEDPAGTVIGTIDLYDFDPYHRRAGVGILIYDASQRGKGYAADALSVLVEYARNTLALHQLWCDIDTRNEASLRLFRRAGFTDAGIRRDWNFTPEGYRDEQFLQLVMD